MVQPSAKPSATKATLSTRVSEEPLLLLTTKKEITAQRTMKQSVGSSWESTDEARGAPTAKSAQQRAHREECTLHYSRTSISSFLES